MAAPVVAQKSPFSADVEAGRTYLWCACGLSKRQPFCDQSHKGSEFNPVEFKATETETVWFCGCKNTTSPPLCDGTHETLQRSNHAVVARSLVIATFRSRALSVFDRCEARPLPRASVLADTAQLTVFRAKMEGDPSGEVYDVAMTGVRRPAPRQGRRHGGFERRRSPSAPRARPPATRRDYTVPYFVAVTRDSTTIVSEEDSTRRTSPSRPGEATHRHSTQTCGDGSHPDRQRQAALGLRHAGGLPDDAGADSTTTRRWGASRHDRAGGRAVARSPGRRSRRKDCRQSFGQVQAFRPARPGAVPVQRRAGGGESRPRPIRAPSPRRSRRG